MHKTYISLGALAAIVVGVLFALGNFAQPAALPVATSTPSTQNEATTSPTVSESTSVPAQQTKTAAGTTTSVPEPIPNPTPNVTLSVAGKSYATFAATDSTVLDVMRALASSSDFTFAGHDYPSLGFFVDSINGRKTEKSHNWILYINGKLSNTGASQTTLKAGDAIEWRYEKNY